MSEIKYEIQQSLGVISETSKGWRKEINLISWNGREAKYDIRDWSSQHDKMGKGVTLSSEELKALRDILIQIDL
mgnify:CR=1 FL=1